MKDELSKNLEEKRVSSNELVEGTKSGKIGHRTRVVAYLSALGFSEKEVAEKLLIPLPRVKAVLSSESVQQEIHRIQEEFFMKNPQKQFMKILPKATEVAYDLMTSNHVKDSVRMGGAFKFMDRALGKPVQELKIENTNFVALYDKLDAMSGKGGNVNVGRTSSVVDAEVVTSKDEEPSDPLDKILEDIL